MASQNIDIIEFGIVLHEAIQDQDPQHLASPYRTAKLASALMRAAKSLHRRYKEACNRDVGTDYENQTDKKERAVVAMLKPYGIRPIFCHDPRGASIRLVLPTGRTNGFGGEGYCVPQ
jgi:hypothetical protein